MSTTIPPSQQARSTPGGLAVESPPPRPRPGPGRRPSRGLQWRVPKQVWIAWLLAPFVVLFVGLAAVVVLVATSGGTFAGGPLAPLATPVLSGSRAPQLQTQLGGRIGVDQRVASTVRPPGFASACIAVAGPGGEQIYGYNPAQQLIPASTTKTITSAAALAKLGPDARFTTQVLSDNGTLYLKGGGDPVLAGPEWIAVNKDRLSTPITQLADQLHQKGIAVSAVVADASLFPDAVRVPGWEARYTSGGDAPAISALAVDRSHTVFPKGAPAPQNAGDNPDVAAALTLARLAGNPGAAVSRGTAPATAKVVASVTSPPLDQILADMNKYSDNDIAEVVLRDVGASGGAGGGTTAKGAKVERETLQSLGVDVSGFDVNDGSGLLRSDRVSCGGFISVLQRMASDPKLAQPYYDSLAVGGTDGTLEKRSLPNAVHAKTGTLADVSTLVGYVDTAGGRLTFAILQNDLRDVHAAHDQQDSVAKAVAAWPSPSP